MQPELGNNIVELSGIIKEGFSYSHEVFGEKFFICKIEVERLSGDADLIPVMVSERLVDVTKEWEGQVVKVNGNFRSYNKHISEGKSRLLLSVFAREFEAYEFEHEEPTSYDENAIFLDGYICKRPNYRKTPLGREIADILLAINRPYGKSDYIPIISWGRNARFSKNLEVGTRLKVIGRIQSRDYQKKISDNEYENRTAFEVSIQKLEKVEENVNEQSED